MTTGFQKFLRHSFFFGIVCENLVRDAEGLDTLTQAVLDRIDGLVEIKPRANYEIRGVIDPGDEVALLFTPFPIRDERSIFYIRQIPISEFVGLFRFSFYSDNTMKMRENPSDD